MDRDEVSQRLFDAPYSHLSAWGKVHVDDVMVKMGMADAPITATLPNSTDPDRMRQDNERLGRELESARLENLDLWDEISELKSQLAEIQAQFNPRST